MIITVSFRVPREDLQKVLLFGIKFALDSSPAIYRLTQNVFIVFAFCPVYLRPNRWPFCLGLTVDSPLPDTGRFADHYIGLSQGPPMPASFSGPDHDGSCRMSR